MVKSVTLGVREVRFKLQILAPLLIGHQHSHLKNGDNNSTHLIESSWELNETIKL